MNMETTYFVIVCLMFTTYVVLDGFDFGAGILHLFVAKTDEERRTVLASIGPFWDGNEVWLVAGGGILFFAFPRAYSASFSGFYLPFMMVLWLLILRGLSIAFRSMEESPLWRTAWDGVFFLSSALMAIVLGAALGNVVRGVPLDHEGYFSGPLFTNFLPGANPGVLDWYTVLVGLFSFVLLAMHGAIFLRMKTDGPVHDRSAALAQGLWYAIIGFGLLTSVATVQVQPQLYAALLSRPLAWVLTVGNVVALVGIALGLKGKTAVSPFLASCALIVLSLATVATGMYPVMLRSTLGAKNDLTVTSSASGALGLQAGLIFWLFAMALAFGYVALLFRSSAGKIQPSEGNGH